MSTPKKTFSDQIRRAVQDSELSSYRICREIGIGEATMSRFKHRHGGLSMRSLDKLAGLLGLGVIIERKPKRKQKGR